MKNIIISGLTASGKTTHSKIISSEFGLIYFGASKLLLEKFGIDNKKIPNDFWTTSKGKELSRKMTKVNIDNMLLEKFQSINNAVFDCLSLPYMDISGKHLSIWLESSLESRCIKSAISHKKN